MHTSIEQLIDRAESVLQRLESILPPSIPTPEWDSAIAFRWRRRVGWMGTSMGVLEAIAHIAPMQLNDLREIDSQKTRLTANIAQFIAGRPANHVLLTGARGTGKSSLIRACLHAYASQGLRLIEVDKDDLVDLPDIARLIAQRPERFMMFCDDLSFEDGETGYKALKSMLDGSVAASASNVLICATSNRRHLLPEYMHENLSYQHTSDGEVHPGEGLEEKISLSERFGLWISFYPFSQDEYLHIVRQWLTHFGVPAAVQDAAIPQALLWALERGSRSGRVAWQFARDFAGRQQMK